jgi:hypothetical protein
MKTILLFSISFLLLSLGVYAQEEAASDDAARTKWIGGNVGYASTGVKDGPSSGVFRFGPQYGMMFKGNLGGGINLNFALGTDKENDATNEITKSSTWEVVPYLRYYMGDSKLKFFGDLYVGVGGTTAKTENDVVEFDKINTSLFKVGVAPGMQYWFNDSWSVVSSIALLEYKTSKTKVGDNDAGNPESEFNLGVDFTQINFGLFYHF